MSSHPHLKFRLARQAFVIVAAAAFTGGFAGGFVAGRVSRSPEQAGASGGVGSGLRMSLAELRESWAAAIAAARPAGGGAKLSADALEPVDSYFREQAIPNVEPFVKDMAGFFTSINLTWLKVRDWWSGPPAQGERGRVEAKVAEALERRMGMPSELEAAVAAAVQRFEALQNQADARFRNEAYRVLRGAGVRVDEARLDEVRKKASHAALVSALHEVGAGEAEKLAAGSIGGLVSSVVVDAVVTSAVTSAVASSAAVGGAGGAAAGGAAAGGAAGSAVPVAGTVAGVVVGGVAGTLVYLAADSYFEAKAKGKMLDAVNGMHAKTRGKLDELFRAYGEELDKQRAALLDRLLVEGME